MSFELPDLNNSTDDDTENPHEDLNPNEAIALQERHGDWLRDKRIKWHERIAYMGITAGGAAAAVAGIDGLLNHYFGIKFLPDGIDMNAIKDILTVLKDFRTDIPVTEWLSLVMGGGASYFWGIDALRKGGLVHRDIFTGKENKTVTEVLSSIDAIDTKDE